MPETWTAIEFSRTRLTKKYGKSPRLVEHEDANFGKSRSKGWIWAKYEIDGEEFMCRHYLRRCHGSWKVTRLLVNGEEIPMNPKYELKQNMLVRYSASEQDVLAMTWLKGLAAGRDLQVVTDGNAIVDPETAWLTFSVELESSPYPQPAEDITVTIVIDGPIWLGAPWARFVSDARAVFKTAPSVQEGANQAIAQFSEIYALLRRYAAAHGEFGETDTPEMAQFKAWIQEHGTDEQFTIVFCCSREHYTRLAAGDLDPHE